MSGQEKFCNPIEVVLERLDRVSRVGDSGKQWRALCPAHDDSDPSLTISVGDDGRVLLDCKVGCTVEAVAEAIGLTVAQLHPPSGERHGAGAASTTNGQTKQAKAHAQPNSEFI